MNDTCKDWDIIFMLTSSMNNNSISHETILMMAENRKETCNTILSQIIQADL